MEYVHVKTIEVDNCIIRVHSPVISAEENQKRMKEIRKAAENLMKKVHQK